MGMSKTSLTGKLAYGALFTLALPTGLWIWNSHLLCTLPSVRSTWAGWSFLVLGLASMVMAMGQLWVRGWRFTDERLPTSKGRYSRHLRAAPPSHLLRVHRLLCRSRPAHWQRHRSLDRHADCRAGIASRSCSATNCPICMSAFPIGCLPPGSACLKARVLYPGRAGWVECLEP